MKYLEPSAFAKTVANLQDPKESSDGNVPSLQPFSHQPSLHHTSFSLLDGSVATHVTMAIMSRCSHNLRYYRHCNIMGVVSVTTARVQKHT